MLPHSAITRLISLPKIVYRKSNFSNEKKVGYPMSAIRLKSLQNTNRATILNFIRKHEPVARHQIAQCLTLSPTTVSSAVSYLIEQKFVREMDSAPSSGGRRPVLLEIDTLLVSFLLLEQAQSAVQLFPHRSTQRPKQANLSLT
ncbi:MAG: MarR family transcriptional regulator [Phycisphaerae bacterium]|nr:MarR family transcriptional regulator [Phycisphaerae bacterium]